MVIIYITDIILSKAEVLDMTSENTLKYDSCSMLAQDDNVTPEICHRLFNDLCCLARLSLFAGRQIPTSLNHHSIL